MTRLFIKRVEYYEIQKLAPIVPGLIRIRGLISVDPEFSGKNLFRSSVNGYPSGFLSINTMLSLWDSNNWVQYDNSGKISYVYKLLGKTFFLFDQEGNITNKYGSLKFMLQYMIHPYKLPYYWGSVNVNLLIKKYDESSTGQVGLFGNQ